MDTIPSPDFVSVLSLGRMARRLGVTQTWLRQEADSGKLPCLRVSKTRYLFHPLTVEQSLARRAAQGAEGESDDA